MPKSYYPPKPLRRAMVLASTIVEKNNGNPMFRLTLAEVLKLKAEGTELRELITASAGYGLTQGSYRAEKIEVTDAGKRVSANSLDAIFDALFGVEVFSAFHDRYGSGSVPARKAATDFLQENCAVPSRQVSAVLAANG